MPLVELNVSEDRRLITMSNSPRMGTRNRVVNGAIITSHISYVVAAKFAMNVVHSEHTIRPL